MKRKTFILLPFLVFSVVSGAAFSADEMATVDYVDEQFADVVGYIGTQTRTLRNNMNATDNQLYDNQLVLRDMLNTKDADENWIPLETEAKLAIPAINELHSEMAGKQDVLKSGDLITISSDNEIDVVTGAVSENGTNLVTAADIYAALNAAVAELDATDDAVAGKFVTSVSETNGVITVTRAALAESDIPTISIDKVDGLQDALNARNVSLTGQTGVIAVSEDGVISIVTGGIGTDMIADNAITSGKIADGAVTAGKIADGAVVAGNLADDAVVAGNLAAGAVEAGNIADGAVVAGNLAAGAVEAGNIANGAVGSDNLAADVNSLLNGAIQAPDQVSSDGMLVLTARVATVDGKTTYTYAWEDIAGRE